uniref:Uncharacterized protein n=1 Tax=viral metagenome TaxID=1070528 RepID=A0A6C0ER13_9ZZZZ
MNSQLFEQSSSLIYSDFSHIKENFSLVEGYTYFDSNNNLNGNLDTYTKLQQTLSNDQKYDFNGNTLLFSDENLLISEQIKKDNEILITSENNLRIASTIAAATMIICAFFLIGSKK